VGYRRRCSRPSCTRHATATLTYVYADSTAVVGPLSTAVEPHSYDLCEVHAARLTAPRGWELIRIEPDPETLRRPQEDMEALANAVREDAPLSAQSVSPSVSQPRPDRVEEYQPAELAGAVGEGINRGHLRAVPGVLPGMDS
jgi:hypothetical protein